MFEGRRHPTGERATGGLIASLPEKSSRNGDRSGAGDVEKTRESAGVDPPVRCRKLAGVNALDNEQTIETGPPGAGKVRTRAIANGENTGGVRRGSEKFRQPISGGGENRGIRLAVHQHTASQARIAFRQSSSAVDNFIAMADDDVRIGAQHVQPARRHQRQLGIVILGFLLPIIDKSGADDIIRPVRWDSSNRRAKPSPGFFEKPVIARRPQMMTGLTGASDDLAQGQFSGRNERGAAKHEGGEAG